MGYSRSRKTLDRMLPLLYELQAGKGTKWVVPQGASVERFAYKIREALRVASIYPAEYPGLAEAAANFKIEIVDRRTVQAVFRPAQLGLGIDQAGVAGVRVHGLEPGEAGPTTLGGEQTAATVIQAWHNTQPSNSPMRFPQANLERDELVKLFNWASKRTPPWLMLVDMNGGLILQPYSRDLDGLGWDPSDE